MSEHQPLKRHPALQPFSRDHQLGLSVARRLRQAAGAPAEDRAEAASAFVAAWHEEIGAHFDDEEILLKPFLAADEQERLDREHAGLRAHARSAQDLGGAAPDPAWAQAAGDALHDHIRWEERELFPAIEARLTASQAAELAQETAAFEARRPRSR